MQSFTSILRPKAPSCRASEKPFDGSRVGNGGVSISSYLYDRPKRNGNYRLSKPHAMREHAGGIVHRKTPDGGLEDPLISRHVQLNMDVLSDGAASAFKAAGMPLPGQSGLLLVRRHELWGPRRGPQGMAGF
jgi:hypothetical protein